jgi:hypothetical protein
MKLFKSFKEEVMWMKIVVLMMTISLFFGCATTANYEKILQSWVGSNIDQLVSAWGPPHSSYTLSDGGSVLEYSNQNVAQIGGYSYTTPQTTYQSGSANVYGSNGTSAYGTYNGTSTTYVQRQTPTQYIQLNCTTRFTTNAARQESSSPQKR